MLHHLPSRATENDADDHEVTEVRDIHALIPTPNRSRQRESWEVSSHRSSTLSLGSEIEHFSSLSTEFNAMVVAGGNDQQNDGNNEGGQNQNLRRIGEEELEETNPLAIVPENNPFPSPRRGQMVENPVEEVSVHLVKKEEVELKIAAWQTAEIAKINNRFKREDVVINGWESEQLEKANARLKKIERKLEEKRARAMEKAENEAAKARQKAEEKRASAEAKRGTKVARVLELSNLMRAVGRAPTKRSFF